MYKTISNEIIRQFHPCYNPSYVIKDENEELPIKDWVQKYRKVVPAKDIIWLLCRKEFLSEKDLRLFAVWCSRESLKLIEDPDKQIVEACNVAERYANGETTKNELDAAYIAADNVAYVAHYAALAARAAARDAYYAALSVANAARAAANAARAANVALADADAAAAANAARVAYFAALAANVALADADAADVAAAVYDATRASQLDQLLTYFE